MDNISDMKKGLILNQLRKSLALARKNIQIYYNKGPVVIFGLFLPLLLFLAFSMNRVIEPMYVISGLLAMIILLTASSVGPIVMPWETMQKTLERVLASPIKLTTLLFGDIWASMFFGSLISIFPIAISIFLGLTLISPIVLIFALISGCFCFACFGIILSSPPTDMPSNVMVLSTFIKFPLLFISPLFMPIESAPWTVISPLAYFVDLINFAYSGKSYFGPWGLLIDFGIIILWTLIFLAVGISVHKKTLQKRFRG